LRLLKYRSAGGNWKTLKKYTQLWGISTDHFDAHSASVQGLRRRHNRSLPLHEVLVKNSTYGRAHVKRRLLAEGLVEPRCELCGQDEHWHGRKLALILDHINGVPNDHRLENLRILCPNCAATLETHCGRKNKRPPRRCAFCGTDFRPSFRRQRYCSRDCGQRVAWANRRSRRKVERPPYEQLLEEIEATSYRAVGRNYGVADNTIRKWIRQYKRDRARELEMQTGLAVLLRSAHGACFRSRFQRRAVWGHYARVPSVPLRGM
jgi:hypothetical protein